MTYQLINKRQTEIRTERLKLRPWRASDREPFAALNADPAVVEFLDGSLTRPQSDAVAERIDAHIKRNGFGFWAVEVLDKAPFVGFIGLVRPRYEAHFTPAIEVGWRLARDHWGNGYATEGARAALQFGWEVLQLREIVSLTVPGNLRSRNVMEKLGMTRNPLDDFDHPVLPEGHPLRPHVLYRISNPLVDDSNPSGHAKVLRHQQ